MNAAIAGYFGVPVVMVSGDDAAVAEVQGFAQGMEGAVVKRAISFHSAATMTPKAGQALIRARVKAGIEQRGSVPPFVVGTQVRAELSFKHYRAAEMLAYLPIVTRVDAHTVRFVGRNILEVSRFIEFVQTYRSDLAP